MSTCVIDRDRLGSLDAATPPEEWRSFLEESGVLAVTPDKTPEGRAIGRLQRAAWWVGARRPEAVSGRAWSTPDPRTVTGGLGVAAIALLLVLAILGGLGRDLSLMVRSVFGGNALPSFRLGSLAVGSQVAWALRGVVCGAAAMFFLTSATAGAWAVLHALGPSVGLRRVPYVRCLPVARAARALLRRPFVAEIGSVVVVNHPGPASVLAVRRSVRASLDACAARLRELERARADLAAANAGLGRPDDDADTVALDQAIARERTLEARGIALLSVVDQRARTMDGLVRRSLAMARRESMLERVEKLVGLERAGFPSEPANEDHFDAGALATEAADFDREVRDDEQRLAAALEVAAIGRTR